MAVDCTPRSVVFTLTPASLVEARNGRLYIDGQMVGDLKLYRGEAERWEKIRQEHEAWLRERWALGAMPSGDMPCPMETCPTGRH